MRALLWECEAECVLQETFGGYQCLVECESVSKLFSGDICQYLVGFQCDGQVSKRKRILCHIMIIFWVTDDRCIPAGKHFVQNCQAWAVCHGNQYQLRVLLCILENLNFRRVKIRKRNPPDKKSTPSHLSSEPLGQSFMHHLPTTTG